MSNPVEYLGYTYHQRAGAKGVDMQPLTRLGQPQTSFCHSFSIEETYTTRIKYLMPKNIEVGIWK